MELVHYIYKIVRIKILGMRPGTLLKKDDNGKLVIIGFLPNLNVELNIFILICRKVAVTFLNNIYTSSFL